MKKWVIEAKLNNEEEYEPVTKCDDLSVGWNKLIRMRAASKLMEYNLREEMPGDEERIKEDD